MENKCPQCGEALTLYVDAAVRLAIDPDAGAVAHTGDLILYDDPTVECGACMWTEEKAREYDYRVDAIDGIT